MSLVLALQVLFLPALLILLAAYGCCVNERKGVAAKLPPGNRCWPLIGETIAFIRPHPTMTMGEFMRQRISRYGKFFTSSLFGERTLVSADAELTRFILHNESRHFQPGYPTTLTKILGKHSASGIVGDAHKYTRSVIVGFLNPEMLRTTVLRNVELLARMILSSWKAKDVVPIVDESKKYTFSTIAKIALSADFGTQETEELGRQYETLIQGIFSIPLNIPGTTYNRALKSRSNILNILKKKIAVRKNKKRDGMGELEDDFLSWNLETDYSEEQMCDVLLSFIFGGYETTSKVLPLVFYFLDDCPKALDQLKKEHSEIAKRKKEKGESSLRWDDYKQMEFTQCVLKEALRLGNIAKFVQRKTKTNVQLNGYDIPSGMNVMAVFTAVHLDPSLFEDAQNFNPWRWQTPTGILNTKNFFAFGGGSRLCLGADLVRLEFAVFLHYLLQTYEWTVDLPELPVSRPYMNFPKGMHIRVQSL